MIKLFLPVLAQNPDKENPTGQNLDTEIPKKKLSKTQNPNKLKYINIFSLKITHGRIRRRN